MRVRSAFLPDSTWLQSASLRTAFTLDSGIAHAYISALCGPTRIENNHFDAAARAPTTKETPLCHAARSCSSLCSLPHGCCRRSGRPTPPFRYSNSMVLNSEDLVRAQTLAGRACTVLLAVRGSCVQVMVISSFDQQIYNLRAACGGRSCSIDSYRSICTCCITVAAARLLV